ncbi:metalloregulator ArsR/SmtB family transcription factor [Oscillatoria sp. FACHB-1406]|uniref:ArsR/SmtB family transcription factor n=1 Tax=Oscillatoria sp. FACHB-1406 TaxID=2692846 RepID=UPI00168963F4|nr:metalloregulator ArsR/SmtB family transcription factor [Oscillatoria sp. FACHB-1406]MBD2578467.1 winged helix-turn-helix transcriptional regulator [Oscillatoria sp. FACHB-1406]
MPTESSEKRVAVRESVEERGISQLTPEALSLMADFFKVLSEVSRLQIVCALKAGDKNVTEIIEETGLGQANVSKHLKMLTQAGIVAREQRGVCVYYRIANPFLFELCDLVCNALDLQVEQQSQQLQQLSKLRSR